MAYSVFILRRAQKELASLPQKPYERIRDAIRLFAGNPRPQGCARLVGRDGWRIRMGNYRVIYEIDDSKRQVTILHVGQRKDVYRPGS